jgi:putative ABC transport system permease protein
MWSFFNLRGGLRILVRNPSFAAAVILVVGLGIGVNTLIFSVADSVLLRPLPYPNPNQLVWISQGVSSTNSEFVLAPDFAVWRSQMQSFAHVAGFSERFSNFVGKGEPEQTLSSEVSADFFSLLGKQPAVGRDFVEGDDRPEGDRVAILSHSFCARRFGEVRDCVGETIRLDEQSFEVIGVVPDNFRFPEPLDIEVFIPLGLGPDQLSREASIKVGVRQIKVIARLRPESSLPQAQAELNVVQQRIVENSLQLRDIQDARLIPLHEHLTQDISQAALVLLAAVSFLWALGCLNVGSLLFARVISRRGEMAVRMSLGASRGVLFRQILVENSVLTFFGCLLSLVITLSGHSFIVSLFPQKVFRITSIQLSPAIVLFVILSFVLTVLIVSFVAAWALPARNAVDSLKSASGTVAGSPRLRRALNVVVICELALAVVLLVEAGLMIRSFWALRYRDLGFQPAQLLSLRVDLTPAKYPEDSQQTAFFENFLGRVRGLPGVEAVALCSSPPPVPVGGMFRLSVEGGFANQPAPGTMVRVQAVNSDYFSILRIPLVKGEMFSDWKQAGPPVVIINRAMARQHLIEDQAVGRKIRFGGSQAPWLTIIGIVEDFKNAGLGSTPQPEAYRPYQQFPLLDSVYVLVRTSSANPLSLVPPIRREVAALDREQPLAEIQTLDHRLTASIAQQRFVMSMLSGFAVLALLLAVVGVYGIMSYVTQQRTREVAVRLALGAQQNQIIWLMVREGLILGLAGAAIGIALARASTHFLASMFHGVAPTDPFTFLIVLTLLMLATILARCACASSMPTNTTSGPT